jgi:hypothetical protein
LQILCRLFDSKRTFRKDRLDRLVVHPPVEPRSFLKPGETVRGPVKEGRYLSKAAKAAGQIRKPEEGRPKNRQT